MLRWNLKDAVAAEGMFLSGNGLVCEDCFYSREEEVEDEAEYWEWLRKQEQDKQAISRDE